MHSRTVATIIANATSAEWALVKITYDAAASITRIAPTGIAFDEVVVTLLTI